MNIKDAVYTVLRFISALIVMGICVLKVKGRHNVPKNGGFLIASNHVSYLDPLALGVACPRSIYYMAKRDLFENHAFALLLDLAHAFPVKRGAPDLGALRAAIKKLKSGKGLLLFPEGTRQQDGKLGDPEAGVGFLAAKAGVPVIPAFVTGTQDALPRGSKLVRRAKITVSFGEQIRIERGTPYDVIASRIMEGIRRLS